MKNVTMVLFVLGLALARGTREFVKVVRKNEKVIIPALFECFRVGVKTLGDAEVAKLFATLTAEAGFARGELKELRDLLEAAEEKAGGQAEPQKEEPKKEPEAKAEPKAAAEPAAPAVDPRIAAAAAEAAEAARRVAEANAKARAAAEMEANYKAMSERIAAAANR